jgi:uncharacterized membrane protein YfcA
MFVAFCVCLFLVALLYSCVGQAGASGYIAMMALFGFLPEQIRPTALILNTLVSLVVSVRFYRAGHLSWKLLGPLALGSVPMAVLGGFMSLPHLLFNRLLGGLLVIAAAPFFLRRDVNIDTTKQPTLPVALSAGAVVGLLSGLTGIGGGILITPLMLYCHWATARTAAAVSAVFILVNSLAALMGHIGAKGTLPPNLTYYAIATLVGGAIGAQLGSLHLPNWVIHRILGIVLLVAGTKLIFT